MITKYIDLTNIEEKAPENRVYSLGSFYNEERILSVPSLAIKTPVPGNTKRKNESYWKGTLYLDWKDRAFVFYAKSEENILEIALSFLEEKIINSILDDSEDQKSDNSEEKDYINNIKLFIKNLKEYYRIKI